MSARRETQVVLMGMNNKLMKNCPSKINEMLCNKTNILKAHVYTIYELTIFKNANDCFSFSKL